MSAAQAAAALAEGVRRVAPDAECAEIPMADGGEGFTESLADALGLSAVEAPVLDAYGRPALARFALADGLAVMECAQAIGLGMVPPERRRIREASTFGVGQMILAALDGGAREFLFGIGGSATNDGGAGMLRALGVRFLDAEGRELDGSPASLARLDSIDASGLDPRAAAATFKIACDVDNPLLGPRGSSAVYGPQKGASPEDVAFLDGILERLARTAGHLDSFAAAPGAGAAGGLGYAFSAFLGGELQSGADLVVEAVGLAEAVKGADFVFTGEGAMDRQTLMGKTLSGVARAAAGVPTLFSSHQLDVVERLCDRVVIIRSGRLVADGTIPELQATETPRWRVVVEQAAGSPPVQAASLNLPAPTVELDDAGRLVITAAGADEQALLSAAQRLGTVRELGPVRHRLTEIFREVLTTTSHEGTADSNETKEAR